MKGILDSRSGSIYDDDISSRYHFPKRYLDSLKACLGDWIIYREPRRDGGREGYVAVARTVGIQPDPISSNHFYATIADFLPFDHVVPLRHAGGFYETRLDRLEKPSLIGSVLQGRSVRNISDSEFAAIVHAGMSDTLDRENARKYGLDDANVDAGTAEILKAPTEEQQRRVAQILLNRKIRDASFRRNVLAAYDQRCAVTGIRMINGGGRAEAQAAHIWSVAAGGPDVVCNGIALSGTIHWLFDRHLVSLTEDYGLLVSHNRVPPALRGLFSERMDRIHLPVSRADWPNPAYVDRHRHGFVNHDP